MLWKDEFVPVITSNTAVMNSHSFTSISLSLFPSFSLILLLSFHSVSLSLSLLLSFPFCFSVLFYLILLLLFFLSSPLWFFLSHSPFLFLSFCPSLFLSLTHLFFLSYFLSLSISVSLFFSLTILFLAFSLSFFFSLSLSFFFIFHLFLLLCFSLFLSLPLFVSLSFSLCKVHFTDKPRSMNFSVLKTFLYWKTCQINVTVIKLWHLKHVSLKTNKSPCSINNTTIHILNLFYSHYVAYRSLCMYCYYSNNNVLVWAHTRYSWKSHLSDTDTHLPANQITDPTPLWYKLQLTSRGMSITSSGFNSAFSSID